MNNIYIYKLTTYILYPHIHTYFCVRPTRSLLPLNTNTHTLAGNNLFNFFPARCFPIVLELMTHTQYTPETHRVGPTHRAEIR